MGNNSQRILLLIPSFVKRGIDEDVAAGRHPRMDYHELARALTERGAQVDIADYSALPAQRAGAKDLRLALHGFAKRRLYDAIFCNSESIALPLGALLRRDKRRPRVVAIGHRISPAKKQAFMTRLRAMDAVDTMFIYATSQQRFATERLGLPTSKVPLIAFHADSRFFTPEARTVKNERPLIASAGLEWRDYPTLLSVARNMPEVDFHLAAASPWSKHSDETAGRSLPPNVTVKRHPYDSLRDLYRRSDVVAVPLYETDFQAGVTTILEAMACGKPVVTSATSGQTDVIESGVNGFSTPPGDSAALKQRLLTLLGDEALRQEIGSKARLWVEQHATLDRWAQTIAGALLDESDRFSSN